MLSVGRHFSAPVIIKTPAPRETRAFLMARDTDAFNRWEAAQLLSTDVLLDMYPRPGQRSAETRFGLSAGFGGCAGARGR